MSPPRPLIPSSSFSITPTKTPRTSLSPPDSTRSAREGRTPPPAPSAVYARRAREIMADEGVSPVMPLVSNVPSVPAVSVSDLGGEIVKPEEVEGVEVGVGFGQGYRRARAGTMPSKLQENDDYPPDPSTPEGYIRTSALSPAYPAGSSPSRPALRHTASSSAGIPSIEKPTSTSPINRPRSGSLGLPQNALGSAFGSSPFSKSWLANPGPAPSPLGNNTGNDENEDPLNSFTPPSEGAGLSTGHLNFSTLDYLGLAEGNDLQQTSMAEAKGHVQKAMSHSGPASRLRASTVSNFARPLRSVASDEYNANEGYDDSLAGAMETLAVYDTPESGLEPAYGFKEMHRPRAITVGTLDNPRRMPRNGYLQSIPQSPVGNHLMHPGMYNNVYGNGGGGGYRQGRSRDSSLGPARGPRMGSSLSMSSHTSRTGTPDFDTRAGGINPQVPTRSLWIGNLDVDATSDTLLHVFAQYGPIESVRMLPEKTCAFVNYLDRLDAMRARDDVLNRLGGYIASLSETAPVRIGFGKIDSAPAGLNTSTVAAPPPGLVFPTGNIAAAAPPPVPVQQSVMASPEQPSEMSSMPTRALWVGSIPSSTSSATLLQIFSPFGPVESARVLMHKCCGFINFERLDSAVSARNALNGRDILGSDVGPIRIGFARVPTKTPIIGGPETTPDPSSSPDRLGSALNTVQGATSVSTETQLSPSGGGVENYRSPLVLDLVKAGVHEQVLEKGLATDGVVSEEQMIMQVLSSGRPEEDEDIRAATAEGGRPMGMYYSAIPVINDRSGNGVVKRFDSARLKDYRKRLELGMMSQEEVDAMALELLEDCAELAADHIGNTVIQKLFERVSYTVRTAMLERVAPHLAMVGVHKNGTWAAQKIIECSVTESERDLITQHLRPFAPPLMCDSLGNYVCAGTLRFGAPYSDYVFDAMSDRLWDIAQNRFGARCMRTCLESPYTSLYQKKRISTGIILNAIPLSTNPNGALLLTWLVDQSNLPGRYGLLANRFAPHVAHLCTHKLASLTVLRIISQTSEPTASEALLAAIFTSPNDQTLTEVLSDANNGAQIIGKILATNTIPSDERDKMISATRRILPSIKASSTPPYRLLLEAVGLPVPPGPPNGGYGRSPTGTAGGWQQPGPGPRYGYMGTYQNQGGPAGPAPGIGYSHTHPGLAPMSVGPGSPGGASPRTPVPHHRGRLSPASQMMSPGSDPFNPFASPSIDVPYLQAHGQVRLTNGMAPMQFEQRPDMGGLGMGMLGPGQGMYYQQSMGMYGRSGYQT